jgi:hypothetical protein
MNNELSLPYLSSRTLPLKQPSISFLFQHVLQQKLKYAIHFCKSIDKDEYARVAMAGDLAVSSSSDAESDPEMDSSN